MHRAFTLVELLVVIAILSLLASIVLASLQESRANAEDSARVQETQNVMKALELYRNEHDGYPTIDPSSGNVVPGDTTVARTEGSDEYDAIMEKLTQEGYLAEVPRSANDGYAYANLDGKGIFQATLNRVENIPTCPGGYIKIHLAYDPDPGDNQIDSVIYNAQYKGERALYNANTLLKESGRWSKTTIDFPKNDSAHRYDYTDAVTASDIDGQCNVNYMIDGTVQLNEGRECPTFTPSVKQAYLMEREDVCNDPTEFCGCNSLN